MTTIGRNLIGNLYDRLLKRAKETICYTITRFIEARFIVYHGVLQKSRAEDRRILLP